ncbi:shieldin complex subunit 3 [Dicentrarchus labrax]|uniref:shieldin complex subunit 3 n=1 Tax=Dicentrarchus labrax TaxID=13489 RepID=UPI0021F61BE9|nr:shieldin complex subunit 3 [Dicentrarchus labrax]
MEDVVLHYQPGSAAGLSSLLERTEKLLEPFPCRTLPVFTPWFPSAADRHPPIRPAKPAPVISCSGDLPRTDTDLNTLQRPEPVAERPHETTRTPQKRKRDVSETPTHPPPASLFNKPESEISRSSPDRHKDGGPVTDSPIKRSWSVFTQKGVLLQSAQSLSKQFHHVVSVHKLHLRQRVKWVISQHHCGPARDIEQVWQTLSRSIRCSRLPTCNANIQRERAEIWVFCDVLHCEQAGRFLKDELRLSGRIGLSAHRLGNIFSM